MRQSSNHFKEKLWKNLGVEILDFKQIGLLNLIYSSNEKPTKEMECHVFLIKNWSGQTSESIEMQPRWFTVEQISYSGMWDDDLY